MSFLSSVFGGQNKTLNSSIPMLSSMSGSLSKSGTAGMNDAMGAFHSILNGDFSSFAPQIASIRKQGGQQMMQLSQFGNRSGGTNAQVQSAGDRTAAGVNDLMASAKTNAMNASGSLGAQMLGIGLQANSMAANQSQMQMENYLNSILGQGLSMGAGFLEGKGLAKV